MRIGYPASNMDEHFLQFLMLRKAKALWCILADKGQGPTLIKDGGMDKPYAIENRKVVEETAKQIGKQHPRWKLEVRTVEDAFNYLLKHNPLFEKELIKKIK